MRCAGHVARTGAIGKVYKFWSENLTGRDHAEDLRVDGKIILELILDKYGGRCELDAAGSWQGPAASCCEHDNRPSGSIKGGELHDQPTDS
jgi:hypothetical protein